MTAMAVSVPKRLFKKAVDRNLLKRRIREAYRLNKEILYAGLHSGQQNLTLIIQYQHEEIQNFRTIEEATIKGLSRLAEQLKEQD